MSLTVGRLMDGGYIASRKDKTDRRMCRHAVDPELVKELFGFMSADRLETAFEGIGPLVSSASALLQRQSRAEKACGCLTKNAGTELM
jgi:hypothetical protein